jgi:hypothetical protein
MVNDPFIQDFDVAFQLCIWRKERDLPLGSLEKFFEDSTLSKPWPCLHTRDGSAMRKNAKMPFFLLQ